jgi:DNA-binding MltR family transcriptional regulator
MDTFKLDMDSETSEFFASLKQESDRGCALVAAEMLAGALEALLRKSMTEKGNVRKGCVQQLFSDFGPLGSFAAKTDLCLALQLIDEELFTALTTIRKVRNKFGHSSGPLTFEEQGISALIDNLKVELVGDALTKMKKDWRPDTHKLGFSYERTRFTLATGVTLGTLHRLTRGDPDEVSA